MGLIDLVQDLESPDVNKRFMAVVALGKLGAAAAPAVPRLAALLRDIDGANVKTRDGQEVMVTIAERASISLAAIGEPAAAAVIEELKKDSAVSAIHCVRALSSPALARRAPVAVLGERLMRPKVSPTMAGALCDALGAAMQSPDEAQAVAARSALRAAHAMGRVTARHQALLSAAPATASSAPAPGASHSRLAPPTPATPPAPAAADSGGWVPAGVPMKSEPPQVAVRPAAPKPPPPAPPPLITRPEPAAAPPPTPGDPLKRPSRTPLVQSSLDRPTSINIEPAVVEPPDPDTPENLRGRTVERPSSASFIPRVHEQPPTAELQPSFTFDPPPTVKDFTAAPSAWGATSGTEYPADSDDKFVYRQQVVDLLKSGEKLKAVNLLRSKTGASLVEALKQIETFS